VPIPISAFSYFFFGRKAKVYPTAATGSPQKGDRKAAGKSKMLPPKVVGRQIVAFEGLKKSEDQETGTAGKPKEAAAKAEMPVRA
jgi:hypothetical protein